MRKIVMSGLVATAALFGCAGPALAGTGAAGQAGTGATATAGKTAATAGPAFARALRAHGLAGRIAASRLERLSAARAQASQSGVMYLE